MTEARSVVVRLSAETAQYIAQMQAAGRMTANAMKPAEAATMRQSAAVDTLGSKAGKLGLVAAAGLAGMAKAAMDWESEWAGVSKTVNGTSEQLNQLEDDLRGLARTMPASHQEIAATAEAAGQLGVATEDVTDFTKVMVEMGTATNLSADQAATSIAQFMNVMESVPADVDQIGNTIVDLGNKGASTESQITDMAQRVAGAGKLIGASEASVLGLSAAMANLGIQSELGGGAVQRVMTLIYSAMKNGGTAVEGFADLAGVSAKQFATDWATDPVRAFDAIIQGMGRVQASGGNVVSTLADLGIKGTQNLQVLLRLAGSGDMLSRSLDQADSAWEKNTALQTEYAKRAETTASQVQVAWNQIKDAAITGGAAILPVVADIASAVGTAADAFGNLPDPIHDVVTALLAVTAITGGGLWLGAKVVRGVTDTRTALATLRPEISRVGTTLATKSGVRQFTSDLAIMASTSRTAGATTQRELERTSAASARVRSQLATVGIRGGLALGGLALATTGAADGMGLTNTMSLALMGTIAGPWGAALGGGIGLVKDLRAQTKSASAAIDDFNDSLDGTDFTKVAAGFQALQKQSADLNADLNDLSGAGDFVSDSMAGWADVFGTGASDLSQASDEAVGKLENLTGVLRGVATANGDFIRSADNGLANLSYGNLDDLGRVAERVQPVLDDLGYSLDYIASLDPGSSEAAKVVQEINDALKYADSDAAHVDEIGAALEGLGNDMVSTADKADALGDALDALLDPNLSLSEATDEWTTSLRHLNDDLDKNNKTINGNSDAAIKNRGAIRDRVGQIKDLLVTEAEAGAGVGKLSKSFTAQRQALLDAAAAAGMSRGELRAYLKELGFTPKIVKTVIQADTDQARSALDDLARRLRDMDGDTATTYVRTVYQRIGKSTQSGGMDGDPSTPQASGGFVPKTGLPYADRHHYLLADGEGVTTNRHGETDRFRDVIGGINAGFSRAEIKGMLADGGIAGAGNGRSLDSRLEIAQILQQIRGLEHDLASKKKGEHLTGLDREIARLQLETAERDLRRAKHAEEREAAAKAREKEKAQIEKNREKLAGLVSLNATRGTLFDGLLPQEPPTVRQGVDAAIADFKDEWLKAGGTWTKALQDWAKEAQAAATQYDVVTAALDAETKKRDELTATFDQLNSTMESFGATVAGNFLNDPFNGAHTESIAGASDGPAATALKAAQDQLATLRNSATADSIASAARASELIAQIKLLQAQADDEANPADREVSGLESLRTTLETDTRNALAFDAALQELAAKGLDTTGDLGGLYQQLASSGDFATAQQLAALSADQIDEYEKLFAAREDAAALVAARATQDVYGQQHDQMQTAIDNSTAAVELLTAQQTVVADAVRTSADAQTAQLSPKLASIAWSSAAINSGVQELPRRLAEEQKKAKV